MARLAEGHDGLPRAAGIVAAGVLGQSGGRIVVRLENLTVSYRQHPALHHISGEFAKGSLTAVIGPNGSGKSTLLKAIMGLLPASGGGVKSAAERKATAYLPQQSELDRSFPMSVYECVLLGGWSAVGAWGSVDQALLARVTATIKAVGLDGFEQRSVGSLSSGQFQRVLFARMMMQDARLILLDEPFAAMDSRTTTALLELIQKWHRDGRTVIAVLHDDAQVLANFPQSLLLARELVAWGATADVLTSANLQRARALAEAWDDQAEICHTDEHTASP